MGFGNKTLVFNRPTPTGGVDEQGNQSWADSETGMPYCRHRPFTTSELIEAGFEIDTEIWRSTIPMKEYDESQIGVLLSLKGDESFTVDGNEYQIVGGARPFDDMASRPYKMTIISKRQRG